MKPAEQAPPRDTDSGPTLAADESGGREVRASERPTVGAAEQEFSPDGRLPAGYLLADRYIIGETLGQGGMGAVYAAQHRITEAHVAVKVLAPERASDRTLVARFLREARTAARLRHPHTIRVHDVLELPSGGAAMIMERLYGCSLAQRRKAAGRLSVGETARIWIPILEALEEAHGLGVVHRDIKPSNIFLHDRGDAPFPKLLDFGIARAAPPVSAQGTEHLTQTGAMLGTPSYMSPEQISGQYEVGPAADLWAVGVSLFECLSGHLPFRGENVGQVLSAVLLNEAPPLRALVSDVPEEVSALVHRCLERRPDLRPGSCRELIEVLEHYVEEPGAEQLPVPEWRDVKQATTTADRLVIPLTRQKTAEERPAQTAPSWRRPLVVSLLLAAAVTGGLMAVRTKSAPPRPSAPPTAAEGSAGSNLPVARGAATIGDGPVAPSASRETPDAAPPLGDPGVVAASVESSDAGGTRDASIAPNDPATPRRHRGPRHAGPRRAHAPADAGSAPTTPPTMGLFRSL